MRNSPVAADGKFHASGLSLGATIPTSQPSFALSCPDPGEDGNNGGWLLNGVVAVVLATFDMPVDGGAKCDCGCGTSCGAGGSTYATGSAFFKLGLGSGKMGYSVGSLLLDQEQWSANIATPAMLSPVVSSEVDVLTSEEGVLRQLKAPQALADIVVISDTEYQISFYSSDQVTGGPDPYYTTTGAPFVTYTIQTPPNTSYTLRITEDRNGNTTENDFVWNSTSGANAWQLTTGNGLRCESMTKTWDANKVYRTETFQVKDGSCSTLVYQEVNVHRILPWGSDQVVTNIVGTGSASQTNIWSYYENVPTSDPNYSHLAQMVKANGYWETYLYDSSGRLTNTIAQYLDSAIGSAGTLNWVTATTYSPDVPQETVVKYLQGQEVSRSYRAFSTGQTEERQCQTAGAAWNASDNLVTITTRLTGGPFDGKVSSVTNPDGTMSLYQYWSDATTMTTLIASGQPGPGGTSIIDGTLTSNVLNFAGMLIVSATYDIASGRLLSQSTTVQTDSLGRATMVISLVGTNNYDYGCCNINSSTNQEGIVTVNSYDALKRLGTTTRSGITTSNAYDAAGNIVATFRNGVRMSASTYDTAGRLTSSTDALTNTTSYVYSIDGNGHTAKTTTYTNQTTRIETYYQDGSLYSVTGTAVHGVQYLYGVDANGQYTQEVKLDASHNPTSEWTKTYTDEAGRQYKTVYADNSDSQTFYDIAGRMFKRVDPDGVTTLYSYNGKGELVTTAMDMNHDGVIEDGASDTDRITSNAVSVVLDHGGIVRRTSTYVWSETGPVLSSVSDVRNDGLASWTITYGVANSVYVTNSMVATYNRTSASRTVTTTNPDQSSVIAQYQNGRLVTNTVYDSTGVQLSRTTCAYDSAGRLYTQTDARTGATTYTYNNADEVTAVSAGGQTTSYQFDSMGRQTQITLPDSGIVSNAYYATGELATNSGARTYTVAYTYDYAGRLQTLKTWRNYPWFPAITTWNYDPERGFLTNKLYQGGTTIFYSNSVAGRLLKRTWARGIATTYAYDNAGALTTTTYSDGTPSVGLTLDRRGRATQVVDGAGTHTMTYNDAGQLLTESFPSSGLAVANSYDSLLRRSTLAFPGTTITYGYDNASRLNSVSDGTHSAAYTYLPNSPLVSNIVVATSGTTKMTTTRNWDNLNRLSAINSQPSAGGAVSYSYSYNTANQRTQATLADGSYWVYAYDTLGQVTSGQKYWSDGSAVVGEQFGYTFDTIGNRKTATANGNTASYTANYLNEYTQRSVPGYVWELGTAAADATVTVNLQPTSRRSTYFAEEMSVDNTSSAVYTQLNTVAVLRHGAANGNDVVTTTTGHEFLPKTPEIFGYDLDGNLTNDGRWAYTWDGENRLIRMQTLANLPSSVPVEELLFGYDYRCRRVSKVVSNFSGSAWSLASHLQFVYDGWNLQAEIGSGGSVARSYVWGLDVSGSMQGAGGIGGLLLVSNHSSSTTNSFVAYDGNGNLTALVDASSGSVSAQYEYGPFGETLRAIGLAAGLNPFRFSTKYMDAETELLYYGYRYYNPSTGRWLSRDPIEESGFKLIATNRKGFGQTKERRLILAARKQLGSDSAEVPGRILTYVFALNDPVVRYDPVGLDCPGCDVPTWLFPGFFASPCVLRACAAHDQCYDANHCTSSSWGSTLSKLSCYDHGLPSIICGEYDACDHCNLNVLDRIIACLMGESDPGGPLYYCRNKHQYISIPGDFPNLPSAKKCCCSD